MITNLRTKFLSLPIPTRRAFWIVLVIGLLLGIFGVSILDDILNARTARVLLVNSIPLALSLLSLLSAALILLGRPGAGGMMFFASAITGLLTAVLLAQGYGFVVAFLILAAAFFVVIPSVGGRYGTAVILTGAIAAVSAILLDAFWTGARQGIDTQDLNFALALAVGLGLVLLVTIFVQFRSYALQSKLIVAFLLVVSAPIFILTYLINRTTEEALTQSGTQALTSAAAQAASSIDTFFLSARDAIRQQSFQSTFKDYLELPVPERSGSLEEDRVESLLTSLLGRDIFLQSYALLDAEGVNLLDTDTGSIGADESANDYFQDAIAKGVPALSNVQIEPDGASSSIFIAAPVRDGQGNIIGMLRARYNAKIIEQIVFHAISTSARSASGQALTGLLVDELGVVLAHTQNEDAIYKTYTTPDAEQIAAMQAERRLPVLPVEDLAVNLTGLSRGLREQAQTPVFSAELSPGVEK